MMQPNKIIFVLLTLSLTLAFDDLVPGCTKKPLGVQYNIEFYSGTVSCGNLLLESDIGGSKPWVPPLITYDDAESESWYTLIYMDPFVNMPNNGTWPLVTTPGSKAPARHWVVGNIDAKMLHTRNLTDATTVSKFKGPSPPWGSHPYGLWLFKQLKGKTDFKELPSPKEIYNWDYKRFIEEYNLDPSFVASNFHITQHTKARNHWKEII